LGAGDRALKGGHAVLPELPDSYWQSLKYFSIYRLAIAAVFFFAAAVYGDTTNLGHEDIRLFRTTGSLYLLTGIGLLWLVVQARRAFNLQLTLQVGVDVLALTILMSASGGATSGVGVMLFVVLAGAGLVGQGRMALFYAALATLAVLGEQTYRQFHVHEDPGGFFRAALTSVGFFGIAFAARLLARRIVTNETLARQRGVELANQLQINRRVIRDMQDGVLVVDGMGQVRQHNPQAETLLDVQADEGVNLAKYSPALSERFASWIANPVETEAFIRIPGSKRTLRARLLPPEEGELALIYLEDMGRIQEQAQQLKLAALGRLTANMAHEIRNPLSAISHAAELLVDEKSGDGQARLIRIIGDNTRRLNRLVAEVLELGRRDRVQPEPIHMAGYLKQFVEEFAINDPGVRERVVLQAEADPVIVFDRTHLHRVLWNLLSNAFRHCSDKAGAVRLSATPAGSSVVELHIVDDGLGIGESLRGQVFEPFFTTHGTGTGLGLYIARELCEANGARLELLENEPGAHFVIVAKSSQ
jgi:two-component system sensor histidine kinase PilS (NtrC family)